MRMKGAFGAPWWQGLVWSAAWLVFGGVLVLGEVPYGTAAAASLGGTAVLACIGFSAARIAHRRRFGRPASLAEAAQPAGPASIASVKPALDRIGDLRERVRNTLRALNSSLCRIAKATQATQDIAVRTNLLALDSMIAAARFAQSGKGFANAATAARSIAGETGKSMAEIGDHIRDINELAASVSETMGAVVAGMEDMADGIVPDEGRKVVRLAEWNGRRAAPTTATEQSPP
ncbi:methyl-accepting chemotaxis protein [Skermanella pratensis]|uniref:methyl-accepting chemotaxis protein n=1 Tax=Skermanella pratensis TaxID=2233999 RepID=UPI001787D902|nr:methyl-accepting chemotaxis protein [Skermanella pratensis]